MSLATLFVCLVFAFVDYPAGQTVYVRLLSENLRDAPQGKKLGTLQKGTPLIVLEDSPKWVKVRLEGWIWKESITDNKTALDDNVYRAYQIVVREQAEAEEILRQLKAGADFQKLAKEKSLGPAAQKGGDLGYFKKGDFQPLVEEVILGLQVGEFSRIVKSDYGYHIFKRAE